MIPESLWERVQEQLDARREPFDDDVVREHLLQHPEDWHELERLGARLEALARMAASRGDALASGSRRPPAAGRRRALLRRRWAGRAAAVAVLLGLASLWWLQGSPRARAPDSLSAVPPAPVAASTACRVLAWKLTITTADNSGTRRVIHGPSHSLMAYRAPRADPHPPIRSFALAWTRSWTRP